MVLRNQRCFNKLPWTLTCFALTFICVNLALLSSRCEAGDVIENLKVLEVKDVSPRDLAQSANSLIAMGEEKGVALLRSMAVDPTVDGSSGFSVNERIGWLCRLVFVPRQGQVLQPPSFGALRLPYHTMPLGEWPEYPLAISGGVIFILSEGYAGTGPGADVNAYINYCSARGHFRKEPYVLPSHAEAAAGLQSLLSSERWRRIEWTHEDLDSAYRFSKARVERFLTSQINLISQ